MRLKGIFVACCLLVFLAVAHGEAGHDETEHVDDQEYELDRERREAGDTETSVDGPAVEKGEGEVIDREKRHSSEATLWLVAAPSHVLQVSNVT
ncbi:hypothetical protein LSAT2_023956 [Lamellibrachia satsuma]|nr:hypothetical protein LSAT2_023956 [Lamellibrachia satsuma]